MSSRPPPAAAAQPSAFAPLRQTVFAVLWGATVLGNVGSFMRDVASAWVVTDLSASPAAVALIQAAATLPIFLLAIPAGVLSDILDRRRLLIGIQCLLAGVSAALLVLAHLRALTVPLLVLLTFLGGVGAALMGPTWQSIVPSLVPRADLKNAVALNSLGVNVARAIGPALGGLLVAALGAAAAYGADLLSYLLVIAALWWWRPPPGEQSPLPEQFFGAFRAGLRYARASRELHIVLLRAGVFFLFASAVWALLPLVARQQLRGDAGFYGVLLGLVGAGAIGGALGLPRLRRRLSPNALLTAASLAAAAVMALLALVPTKPLALALMLLLGVAWIVALTVLNSVTQAVLPDWVRGRGLAIYLTVFNGALAGGSLGWGLVAQSTTVPTALLAAAAGLVLLALGLHRVALPAGEADLTPSGHWPLPPEVSGAHGHDARGGPVLVQIEYRVRPQDVPAFVQAARRLSVARRRDGAYAWGLARDSGEPQCVIEWFLVESWAEHMRQHQRVTHADADLQAELRALHTGPEPPRVRHLLSV